MGGTRNYNEADIGPWRLLEVPVNGITLIPR